MSKQRGLRDRCRRGGRPSWVLRQLPLCALLACGPALAAITTSGSVGVGPVSAALGPGNTVLPTSAAWVGSPLTGGLTVDGGSFLQLARLSFGSGGTGNGTGLVSGSGTRVELVGDGTSNSQVQRLLVGDFGVGQLTVNSGAVVDTSGNQTPCLLAFHYCDSFVGGAAGDTAVLSVDGAGSRVRIGQSLFIAQPGLAIAALDGYTYGVPGGITRGTVNVTNGAALVTDRAQIGPRHWSEHQTGQEKAFAELNISGAGSRWEVVGGNVANNVTGVVSEGGAGVSTANDPNSWASLSINSGGQMLISGKSGVYNFVNLTGDRGRTDMTVDGAASSLLFTGDAGVLQVGRSLGSASLSVTGGAQVGGMFYLSVGRDGSSGNLLISGSGSRVRANGTASASANGVTNTAGIDIGRNGSGVVTVAAGGALSLEANEALGGGTQLSIGREAASFGRLNITGAGSLVTLSSRSVVAGGGAGESTNPFMRVGRDGGGELSITAGGKLLIDGQAVSTAAASRSTNLYIGGTGDATAGGKGIATVSGTGSEIRMTGFDAFIGVGVGPQSFGQLTVTDNATVSAIGSNVGRSGGVGILSVDHATLNFSGQQTGSSLSGAFLSIGRSGGTGVATLGNGSVVTLSNPGSSGASLSLGGTSVGPLGDGTLTVSGGSSVRLIAAPGLAQLSVARDGTGLMRVKGASTVDVGDGLVHVGRLKGSDGTLLISEGSSLSAGWIGVGRSKSDTGSVDGGTGTLVLTNSTLTASEIVIGTNGFLGGTGTITGNVTNHGIFAPGNSPGTMTIAGDFSADAGSRLILEVESDGAGGYRTDHLIFGAGSHAALGALKVEFRFLGVTDPTAFRDSGGFRIDDFLAQQNAGGALDPLGAAAYQQVQFSAQSDAYAISNFSYSVTGGASFTAVAVPEPGSWLLMLAGVAALLARRRAADQLLAPIFNARSR